MRLLLRCLFPSPRRLRTSNAASTLFSPTLSYQDIRNKIFLISSVVCFSARRRPLTLSRLSAPAQRHLLANHAPTTSTTARTSRPIATHARLVKHFDLRSRSNFVSSGETPLAFHPTSSLVIRSQFATASRRQIPIKLSHLEVTLCGKVLRITALFHRRNKPCNKNLSSFARQILLADISYARLRFLLHGDEVRRAATSLP